MLIEQPFGHIRIMHASTLQKHFEPFWTHSFSSWIGGKTSWSARSRIIKMRVLHLG
jgi:hypothetical protein